MSPKCKSKFKIVFSSVADTHYTMLPINCYIRLTLVNAHPKNSPYSVTICHTSKKRIFTRQFFPFQGVAHAGLGAGAERLTRTAIPKVIQLKRFRVWPEHKILKTERFDDVNKMFPRCQRCCQAIPTMISSSLDTLLEQVIGCWFGDIDQLLQAWHSWLLSNLRRSNSFPPKPK